MLFPFLRFISFSLPSFPSLNWRNFTSQKTTQNDDTELPVQCFCRDVLRQADEKHERSCRQRGQGLCGPTPWSVMQLYDPIKGISTRSRRRKNKIRKITTRMKKRGGRTGRGRG